MINGDAMCPTHAVGGSSLLKSQGYFTYWSCIIIILYYTAFVKEGFSADCNGYHTHMETQQN